MSETNQAHESLGIRSPDTIEALRDVERRLLWLSTRIIDVANRRSGTEIKVGGHQASCASMVSIMTALWFRHIDRSDKVAIKPHAAPVYHAIKYLTGELDRSYLTKLRMFGGLQAYPSRTKDPDVSDYSTGSVGLGAVAPLFSALTRRYVEAHFGSLPKSRFIATLGDAELDEGSVWEAIIDPVTKGLGNVMFVVDLNRQSLDRVVPGVQATSLKRFFADAGWHVAEAKYGSKLQAVFGEEGGDALRARIDGMPNEAYQSLFGLEGANFRQKFTDGADRAVIRKVENLSDTDLRDLVTDLGGHDLEMLVSTFESCDAIADQPSIVFAYTIKGWGLPIAGDPLNHAALLSKDEIDALRSEVGLDLSTEWDRFDPSSDAGRLCAAIGAGINNTPPPVRPKVSVPPATSEPQVKGNISTQEAFGRILTRLGDLPEIRSRLVTTAPDVSVSTNLGGWINKTGVYFPVQTEDHGGAKRLLKWAPSPDGQHIELGISETNMFMLLGQLGLSHEHHGQMLYPVGTVYDPFVLRGLDALIYGLYSGSRFVVAGTPSGVTLAPEGGAHQSSITAAVGAELPNLHYVEPAFATEVDWLLCEGLTQLGSPDGESLYLRLSSRPISQAPFASALQRYGEGSLREHVLAGGYRLVEGPKGDRPGVTIVTTGVMAPEALLAAAELDAEGVDANVIHLTSPDRAYRSWQRPYSRGASTARAVESPSHLHRLIPESERARANHQCSGRLKPQPVVDWLCPRIAPAVAWR